MKPTSVSLSLPSSILLWPQHYLTWAYLVVQTVKNLPLIHGMQAQSLSGEDPLEKGMATPSNILDWTILWTEDPGGPQYMGFQKVGHDWVTNTLPCTSSSQNTLVTRSPQPSPLLSLWVVSYPMKTYTQETGIGHRRDSFDTLFFTEIIQNLSRTSFTHFCSCRGIINALKKPHAQAIKPIYRTGRRSGRDRPNLFMLIDQLFSTYYMSSFLTHNKNMVLKDF